MPLAAVCALPAVGAANVAAAVTAVADPRNPRRVVAIGSCDIGTLSLHSSAGHCPASFSRLVIASIQLSDQARVARLCQKRAKLSSPPNRVLKVVRSASKISPARVPLGGIQRKQLNSRFPASVNGCGLDRSIGCRAICPSHTPSRRQRSEEHTSELPSQV